MKTPTPFSRRRLPARSAAFVLPLLLSVVMTFVVSAIATARGIGVGPAFLWTWMSAWALSWVIAFPTLLVVMPFVRRMVALIVEPPPT